MTFDKERFQRRPGLAWREEEEARRDAIDALDRGEDAGDEGTLIVVDGGGIFELNLLGADVWKRLDGEKTVAEIVKELTAVYDVSAAEILADVTDFLRDLEERGWVEKV